MQQNILFAKSISTKVKNQSVPYILLREKGARNLI